MNDTPQPDLTIDARGLECPLPILRTRAAVADMQPGQQIRVLCTDPHAEMDFEAFCARFRHPLLGVEQHGDEWHFSIEIGPHPQR